jgi:hypothetical protein
MADNRQPPEFNSDCEAQNDKRCDMDCKECSLPERIKEENNQEEGCEN